MPLLICVDSLPVSSMMLCSELSSEERSPVKVPVTIPPAHNAMMSAQKMHGLKQTIWLIVGSQQMHQYMLMFCNK